MQTRISRAAKEVTIGHDQPTILIGERINPTGKKKLSEALKAGNLDIIRREAAAQVQAGADVIDVNVGAFGVDESSLLPQAVQAVMDTVDAPLCIDSAKIEALEAALRVYEGKPLINSVSGEEHSLSQVLPLVKEYGAAVIGLVQDDEGIPTNTEKRVAVAQKIVERAGAAGIPREDIVIDCLAFAVGADTRSGPAVLEAIRRIRAELGVNTTLGASNVSFGLPNRDLLNSAFVSAAISAGATCLIADVAKIRPAVLAIDLITGRDNYARRYVEAYRKKLKSDQP
jgi:5-methyltetrahydrofolate--homocysteine methyltransferase